METIYLTQERFDELSEELEKLKTKGRREVAERLKHAKELGDLSENSDYQEAREEQSRLEYKINQVEEILRTSSIIKKSRGFDSVRIGSKVEVKRGAKKMTYTIVGSSEASPLEGLISNESPMGKALLGKKPGDEVSIETPKGKAVFKILDIK